MKMLVRILCCSLLLCAMLVMSSPTLAQSLPAQATPPESQTNTFDIPIPILPAPDENKAAEPKLSREDVQKLIQEALKEQQKKEKEKASEKEKEKKDKKESEWYEVGTDLTLYAKWKNGPIWETKNGDFQWRVTGRFHWDTGWFTQSEGIPRIDDASSFRRARIGFQGKMWETVFYRMAYEFADPTLGERVRPFRDIYVGMDQVPFIGKLIFGQQKELLSLSWMTTSNELIFMERPAVVTAVVPRRSVGVNAVNTYMDERIWVGTGFFRGDVNDGGYSEGDGEYAWTSRLTCLPFWEADGRYLLHLGGGYSRRGTGPNQTSRIRTRHEVALGAPDLLDTGNVSTVTDQNIYSAEFATVIGPFSATAEWLYRDGKIDSIDYANVWGAYVELSYFLTGEHRNYRKSSASFVPITPYENFFCVRSPDGTPAFGLGAWEVTLRYSYLNLRNDVLIVPTQKDGSGGTGTLDDITVGLNWYWNYNTSVMLNYIHAIRDSDTPGRDGTVDTLAIRFRLFY